MVTDFDHPKHTSDYFRLMARKIRNAGWEVCRTCGARRLSGVEPPFPQCKGIECRAKNAFRSAAAIERDIAGGAGPPRGEA
ncbi:MAG: hypothetical protein COW30_14090 [Rhodospirillales bacterium CG15_BIG_FIL_POST_REV_8_21_14_020_66_15]|nr:MAG: hypothetical protein COW30_14090 [Rhodospirillales bacterium CG15_BIG_FIL_POST_REV_8_21_14_020_66_15]